MTTHHESPVPTHHKRTHAGRRRWPILPNTPHIRSAQPLQRALRRWEWLALVVTVSLVGISMLAITYSGRRDQLIEYPRATNVIHTIRDNLADPLFAQTMTFQTSDSPETILAFYQTRRPLYPRYTCRAFEQTAMAIEIGCQAFRTEGTIYYKHFQITVATIDPQTRMVQVVESGSVTRIFAP